MSNGFGSTLMMRYRDLPPYRRSRQCKKGSYKQGRNCKDCCLVSEPIGFRRCFNQCSTSGFGRKKKIPSSSFGRLGLKNRLKLAMQKRDIASRKIRQILDKPVTFIGNKFELAPLSLKQSNSLRRWGEIYKRENKKVIDISKTIRNTRSNKFSKTKPRRRGPLPPPLRSVPTGSKRLRYTLDKSATERRKAIKAGINSEMRKRGITKQKAAVSKKGRLNVLRIYRRYSNPRDCKKITMDMRWIDRTYLSSIKGKTTMIC